jgi:hypothetical protein
LVYHAQAASKVALGRPAQMRPRFDVAVGGVLRRVPGTLTAEIAKSRRQLGRA